MDIERGVMRGLLYVVLLVGGMGTVGAILNQDDGREVQRIVFPVCFSVAIAGLACSARPGER